jgi:hypothetical protein
MKAVSCCLELFVSGVLAPHAPVTFTTVDSSIAGEAIGLNGLFLGFQHRLYTDGRHSIWWGGHVGGYLRDRSEPSRDAAVVAPPSDATGGDPPTDAMDGAPPPEAMDAPPSFTFPGAAGLGLHGEYRYRINDTMSVDSMVRWQWASVQVGQDGEISWHPIAATVGIVIRVGGT